MTVSIHATPGLALVISPHQSATLPAQPAGEVEANALGRWRGDKSDGSALPHLCHSRPPCPSVSLHSGRLCLPFCFFFCCCCFFFPSTPSAPPPLRGLVRPAPSQPRLNRLRPPVPAAPIMASAPVRDRRVSLISLSASPSPSSVADTPTQMISRHTSCPENLARCQSPPSGDNLPSACSLDTPPPPSGCSVLFVFDHSFIQNVLRRRRT